MLYITRWVSAVSNCDFTDANVIHRNLIHISCSNGKSITDVVYGPASGIVALVTLTYNDQQYCCAINKRVAEDLNVTPDAIYLSEDEILEKIKIAFEETL